MSSRPVKKNACSAPHKTTKRPYAGRPRSGPGRMARSTPPEKAIRVIMPDEPPRLNPEAAQVLLRILLKAYDRLAETDNPHGGDAE